MSKMEMDQRKTEEAMSNEEKINQLNRLPNKVRILSGEEESSISNQNGAP